MPISHDGRPHSDIRGSIGPALAALDAIGLEGLDAVKLLNRTDTKFMFHASALPDVLAEIAPEYYVLEIDGRRIFDYDTLYFDTDDFALYRLHHNGKPNRLKVRFRKYLDSGLCYFEVKHKLKGARTDKRRAKVADFADELGHAEAALIDYDGVAPGLLRRKMAVRFSRITLASRTFSERLTLDLDIGFDNRRETVRLPDIVIAEVKADKQSRHSPIVRSFKRRRFERTSFSKYATSVAMLEAVKANAFKPNLIRIERIANGKRGV
ncbi:MAG: polyphosphate polymerase domain-containing protein [Ignavibacteria bacterium]